MPAPGGGQYWASDDPKRDFELGHDENAQIKFESLEEVLVILTPDWSGKPDEEKAQLLAEASTKLDQARLMSLTEFGRAVHAEMDALLAAGRVGVSVRGGELYCTTFPCHSCAKHIVNAGICRVLYIEPYPKSLAERLHGDAEVRTGMSLDTWIEAIPKVELHVHLEGAIQPETLLLLAQRNGVALPADNAEGLRRWYTFTGFPHFIEIYLAISSCICTPDDIELVARDFLRGQAAQHIRYSEVTYTPYTHYSLNRKIPFADQIAALDRARRWAEYELGIGVGWVLDISRNVRPVEHGLTVAEWAISSMDKGVVALGLGGPEVGHPPALYAEAFDMARAAGLASVPHAGETVGPESIRGALDALGAQRIGHGVRCLEEPELVTILRERQIPLEVCPTSNICLSVFPSFAAHPLPQLLAEGLYVTLNSDDPPMFNTTLTNEYRKAAQTFGLDAAAIERLILNAVRAALLPAEARSRMEQEFQAAFARLRVEHGV